MVMKSYSAAKRRYLPASPYNVQPDAPPVEKFAVRDRVTHDRYGLGRVSAVENEHAVVVDFAAGQMRITTPFPKLTKL